MEKSYYSPKYNPRGHEERKVKCEIDSVSFNNICFEACLPRTHFYSIHIIINHMPIAKELPQGQVK